MDEVGLDLNQQPGESAPLTPFLKSPHAPAFLMMEDRAPSTFRKDYKHTGKRRTLPKFLALDLTRLHNLDGKYHYVLAP